MKKHQYKTFSKNIVRFYFNIKIQFIPRSTKLPHRPMPPPSPQASSSRLVN